jgi:hypothetical protein
LFRSTIFRGAESNCSSEGILHFGEIAPAIEKVSGCYHKSRSIFFREFIFDVGTARGDIAFA